MKNKKSIEKEVKGLLTQDTYNWLQEKINWDAKLTQINFYYTNKYIDEEHTNTQIRIRCIDDTICLQIKIGIGQGHHYRECIEYEVTFPYIPIEIAEETLKLVWDDYDLGPVYLIGFLVTERAIKKAGSVDIMLDRNIYNGKKDYEIEFECDNIEHAKQAITALGLDKKLMHSFPKYRRFCKTRNL